jgi:hypothetical protein
LLAVVSPPVFPFDEAIREDRNGIAEVESTLSEAMLALANVPGGCIEVGPRQHTLSITLDVCDGRGRPKGRTCTG